MKICKGHLDFLIFYKIFIFNLLLVYECPSPPWPEKFRFLYLQIGIKLLVWVCHWLIVYLINYWISLFLLGEEGDWSEWPPGFCVFQFREEWEHHPYYKISNQWFSSVAQSCPILCDLMMDHSMPGLPVHHQLPVYPNSCPLSRWCHPTISSSVVPFSSSLQSFPASESFQMSQLFPSGSQSIGVSASTSVLPMNTQDWSPLGWTGWSSLKSKGLSRVFSNTTVQKHQFFSAQLSFKSNSHIHTWLLEKP